jgi:hypothetical protein
MMLLRQTYLLPLLLPELLTLLLLPLLGLPPPLLLEPLYRLHLTLSLVNQRLSLLLSLHRQQLNLLRQRLYLTLHLSHLLCLQKTF